MRQVFFGPDAYGHKIAAARVVAGNAERVDLGDGISFSRSAGADVLPARCSRCHAPLSDMLAMRAQCPGAVVPVRVAATRLAVELEVGSDARAGAEVFSLDTRGPVDAYLERALL